MNNLNRVILQGNLTRDPDLKYTPSGVAVCEFSIAVNRSWTKKDSKERTEEVSYFDIVVFKRTAEVCGEHLKKGRAVLIEGQLKQERWRDEEKQINRSRVGIIASSVHFLGPKPGTGEKVEAPAGATEEAPEPPF